MRDKKAEKMEEGRKGKEQEAADERIKREMRETERTKDRMVLRDRWNSLTLRLSKLS